MDNEQLISKLLQGHRPVSRRALSLRLTSFAVAGLVVAIVISVVDLKLRPDIIPALVTFPFWMKWIYVAALGVGGLLGVHKIARPDAGKQPWIWLLGLPVVVMAILATFEFWQAPPGSWPRLWRGISWDSCPLAIAELAIPIFACLILAFRKFAPVQLRMAGFLAGLASGGLAAFAYALHCPEASAVFIAIWYSAGVAIPTLVGVLIGPHLLRW